MSNLLRPFLVPAIALATCVASQAALSLPGKTLGNLRPGLQPTKNAKNILKGHVSTHCPHIGKSLRDLLNYSRATWPALYRQALKFRRTGFTQEDTRIWLEGAICSAEGF